MTDNDRHDAPAKPMFPLDAPPPADPDQRGLVERALEAHERERDQLDAVRKERETSEWQFALSRLMAAYGGDEDTYAVVDSEPYPDGQWITTWTVDEEEDFGFVVIREGRATTVHLTAPCEEHGHYAVAHQIEPTLRDLGRHLERREQWRCPACQLAELQGELDGSEDDSPEAVVGRTFMRAVESTVRGILAAERDRAMQEFSEQ